MLTVLAVIVSHVALSMAGPMPGVALPSPPVVPLSHYKDTCGQEVLANQDAMTRLSCRTAATWFCQAHKGSTSYFGLPVQHDDTSGNTNIACIEALPGAGLQFNGMNQQNISDGTDFPFKTPAEVDDVFSWCNFKLPTDDIQGLSSIDCQQAATEICQKKDPSSVGVVLSFEANGVTMGCTKPFDGWVFTHITAAKLTEFAPGCTFVENGDLSKKDCWYAAHAFCWQVMGAHNSNTGIITASDRILKTVAISCVKADMSWLPMW